MIDYPLWICHDCGQAHGRALALLSTWHQPDPADDRDRCGWCKSSDKPLTEPRDYGYPVAPKGDA